MADKDSSSFIRMVDELLADYRKCHDAWAIRQRKTAEGFNLLEVMAVDDKELCHSRLLEWLLAWDIEQGTHAQGNLGLRLFLEDIGLDSGYVNTEYSVRREAVGKKSRIDIEIAANETFIIHIRIYLVMTSSLQCHRLVRWMFTLVAKNGMPNYFFPDLLRRQRRRSGTEEKVSIMGRFVVAGNVKHHRASRWHPDQPGQNRLTRSPLTPAAASVSSSL